MKLLSRPPRFISIECDGILCPIDKRFKKEFRPYIQRSIIYLPPISAGDDEYAQRFMSHAPIWTFERYCRVNPGSLARSCSLKKAIGDVDFQEQKFQAIVVFIEWMENDDERIKQYSFKADFGNPKVLLLGGKQHLGIEEQNCKFHSLFRKMKDLSSRQVGQFEKLEYFGPEEKQEEKKTCKIM